MTEEFGEIENFPYEIKHFEWRIPDFFRTIDNRIYDPFCSPTFAVADTSWQLSLHANWYGGCPYIQLLLCNDVKREYLVEYYLGLKRQDGSIKQLLSGILTGNESHNDECTFIKKSELLQLRSELVPGNVLTITCTLKLMTKMTHSSEQTALDATRHLMLIKLDKLSENFKDLLGNKETCDVILKVKEKEYKAHRAVLIARSSVFAANFRHNTLDRQTGVITIPDCEPDSFQKFLEYLYCGKLEDISPSCAQSLYYTSDKYDIEELKAFCINYLMQCLTVENMCEVVIFADKFEETQLFSAVQDFFNKNLYSVVASPQWECLLKTDYRLANKLIVEMAKEKHKQ